MENHKSTSADNLSYLEVKHTPAEISVGNIKKTWRKFRPVNEQTRSLTVHLCTSQSGAHGAYDRNPNTMMTQTKAYCLSAVSPSAGRVRSRLVLCAKKRRGRRWTDMVGGRRCGRWWGEDERWGSLLIAQMGRISHLCTFKEYFWSASTWKTICHGPYLFYCMPELPGFGEIVSKEQQRYLKIIVS